MDEIALAERGPELRAGHTLLRRARDGAGGLLLIEGPAGIGKTTLLRALERAADGFTLFRADGDELSRSFAYGVVRGLFERPLTRDAALHEHALAGAASGAGFLFGAHGESSRSAGEVQHALTWLVSNLADEMPVALVIDDLGWSDPASLAWVAHLVRRAPDLAIAVLATWRTGDPGSDEDALDRLRTDPATTVVRPPPLTDDGVARLVRETLGEAADPALCEACARASGGNPFLLVELLRSITDRGNTAVDAVNAVRPESIERSVQRRLSRLGDAARAAATACAVLGEGGEMRHVEALGGLNRLEAVAALDALTESEVLAPGRPLAFVHPLVRRAVYDGIAAHTRGQMHAQAARLLAAEGADEMRIAAHLASAPPTADAWACDTLHRTGVAALARGAPAEATALLHRALDEPPSHEARPAIELALGTSLLRMRDRRGEAHLASAIDHAADAATRARAIKELMAHQSYARLGDPGVLIRAREELGPEDRELALELQAAAIATGLFFTAQSNDFVDQFQQLSSELQGETTGERLVLAVIAWWMCTRPDSRGMDCASLAERALGDGEVIRERPDSMALLALAQNLAVLDRVESSRRAIDAGIAAARDRRDEVLFGLWSSQACFRGHLHGELVEAEAAGRGVLPMIDALPQQAATATAAYLAPVLIDRGALDEAELILRRALANVRPEKTNAIDLQARRALTQLRTAQHRWSEVAAEAEQIGEQLSALGMNGHPNHTWRCAAAIAYAALGEPDCARELLTEQWVRTRAWDTPRLTAITLRAEGIVEHDPDRLRAAVDLLSLPSHRLERARTLLDLGAMLRRRKARTSAREILRQALDLADRAGATRIADLAREEISASGGTLQRARLSGVESLTPSELRIARMAAEGMSNPEIAQALFVTRKTVETHMSAILRKLEITRRSELPQAMTATT